MILKNEEEKEAKKLIQNPEDLPESENAPYLVGEVSNSAESDLIKPNSMDEAVGSENDSDHCTDNTTENELTIIDSTQDKMKQILDTLVESFTQLDNRFLTLQGYFDSKIRYDESKEKMIDSLHKELQAYREGLHFRHIRPIAMGLIDLHDDLESVLTYQTNQVDESADAKRMRQNLEVTRDSIQSILEENGVVGFSEPDDMFERKRQRVQRNEVTVNPDLAGKVCKRLHMGFEYEGIVLRPELISTWKYIPEQEN